MKVVEILPRAVRNMLAASESDLLQAARHPASEYTKHTGASKKAEAREKLVSQFKRGTGVLSSRGGKSQQVPKASTAVDLDFFFGLQSGLDSTKQLQEENAVNEGEVREFTSICGQM